jgi:hypothetical protein
MEAIIIDIPVKTAAPRRTMMITPRMDQSDICNWTPRMMAKTKTINDPDPIN